MLHTDFPDLNVVIAGSEVPYAAGYRERLQQIARGQGIEDRVEFVGHVEPVQEVLSRLTVLVQASYAEKSGPGGEAFGLALAEASWAGLPVVATRTGGIPEQVHDRVTGLLVSPRRPDELARAIHHIFSDPDLARRMGERGARQARIRFDPHEASRRLFHELKRCL
jgi:glycosyltransferase involved in cell wall biosynthesis